MNVAIIIPVYKPNNATLQAYTDQIITDIQPDTVRIELDATQEDSGLDFTHPVEINTVGYRRGKGKAITDGFRSVSADVLCFVDGDGSVSVSSIREVIDPVRSGTYDIAIGSRRLPESTVQNHQTVIRRLMGKVLIKSANTVLSNSLTDYQCGVKCISKNSWKEISNHCTEEGFTWDLEFISIADALGYELIEVPIKWEDHPDSTVSPVRAPINFMTTLVKIRKYMNDIQDK